MEYKLLNLDGTKAAVKDDGSIEGYGSTFGNVDQGGDIVMPGAFAQSLKERTPKMLYHHDTWQVIGVWKEAVEDKTGLFLKGQIARATQKGAEAYELLKMGAIEGLSIGFRTVTAKDTKKGRELHELKLHETSIVTFPMNELATVTSVKELEAGNFAGLKRNVENLMRDAGFPAKEAKAAAAACAERVKTLRDATDSTAVMADELTQFMRNIRN